MATRKLSILNHAVVPQANGDVVLEPMSVAFDTASPLYDFLIWNFRDVAAAAAYLYGAFQVPEDYVGSPSIEAIWSAVATSGTLDMDFGYRSVAGDNTTTLDMTTDEQTVNATQAAPGTARFRRVLSMTGLTAGNFTPGETIAWRLSRDSAGGGDIAASIWLLDLNFVYADA